MVRILKKLKRRLRTWHSDKPMLYMPFARFKHRALVVTKKTEIVIEGYPRSANSFAEAGFRLAQDHPVDIAHHLHAAAQILKAAQLDIPTLVIIRDPVDAARSLIMHEPDLFDPVIALSEYQRFYSAIEPIRSAFVLARFESITTMFPDVINIINKRFNTQFKTLKMTPETLKTIYEEIDRLSFQRGTVDENGEPYSINRSECHRKAREAEKIDIQKELDGINVKPMKEKAVNLYQRLVAHADI